VAYYPSRIFLVALLIAVNGFFAGAEVALLSVRHSRLRQMAENGAAGAQAALNLLSNPGRLLSVTQVGVTLASLGLVGILESRHALRERIERLLDFRPPRQAGLTRASWFGIALFAAVAVPMGHAQEGQGNSTAMDSEHTLTMKVNPTVFIKNVQAEAAGVLRAPTDVVSNILQDLVLGEGVDCLPPHELVFDADTGEIATTNSADAVTVIRQVIEPFWNSQSHGGFQDQSSLARCPLRSLAQYLHAGVGDKRMLAAGSLQGMADKIREALPLHNLYLYWIAPSRRLPHLSQFRRLARLNRGRRTTASRRAGCSGYWLQNLQSRGRLCGRRCPIWLLTSGPAALRSRTPFGISVRRECLW